MHKTLMIFGTRPEIIKLGPVYRELSCRPDASVDVFWTGQHMDLADGLMELFSIEVKYSASDIMAEPGLVDKAGRILKLLGEILRSELYNSIVVQGDTLSAMCGAMAGFFAKVPVAHVEAGLRTFNLDAPWPEEYSRRVIGIGAAMHFPPTQDAADNLLREGAAPSLVHVTGNTVVDALKYVQKLIGSGYVPHNSDITNVPTDKKLILVTGHRRENFGEPMTRVLKALSQLAEDGDKFLLFPVHPNPAVRQAVADQLGDCKNILLTAPLRYKDFTYLLGRAWTVITDSGGIQEEAPTFGLPVVITRETTERPEVVTAGFGHLVGSNTELIIDKVRSLTAGSTPTRIQAANPFGDGHASERIASILLGDVNQQSRAARYNGAEEKQPALMNAGGP